MNNFNLLTIGWDDGGFWFYILGHETDEEISALLLFAKGDIDEETVAYGFDFFWFSKWRFK